MQSGDTAYRRAVGKRIRVWRVLHDRSQDELAAEAGVTRNFVSAIERGAQGRLQQRPRVRVAQSFDPQLRQPAEISHRRARGEHQRDGLRQQAAGDERERLPRGLVEPLRVVDQADQRLLLGGV